MKYEVKLIVDFDPDTQLFFFVVKENGVTVQFRPGFRTSEEAQRVGDAWIADNLGESLS